MNHKILIVDDEPANLRLLERLFRADYQVITASSGGEALELLEKYDVAVIVSDQRMPGMTGIEFLKRAAVMRQHTVRIILTGYTDVNALVEAINSGVVYKYVSKPWANEDLMQTVARALEHHETNKRQSELKMHNERLERRLAAAGQSFVRLVAEMLDLKDEYAHDHARRTAGYAVAVGHRLSVGAEELEQLELAAYLHDVGRIGIPDELLHRNSAPTEEESRIIKRNSERAIQILAAAPDMSEIALVARHVGNRFDGGGFPDNLSAERIPLFSRIVAVACAYDKMTCPRAFEPALTHDEAVERLQTNSGKQFDPNVVEAFCRLKSVGQIRRAIDEGSTGMRLLPSRIFSDTKSLPTAELLQKFKTEPMMALDMLKLANAANSGEKTARMMRAMTALGEAKLRMLLEHNGLPASDAKFDGWTARAARRGVVAQLLAGHTEIIEPDEAYALGLLYDAGEVLLGNLFPEEMLELEKIDDDEDRFLRQIEIFGIDSIQVSRLMLEACGLPAESTAAVKSYRELMHIDNPAALLLHAAHKMSAEKEPGKTAADVIGVDCLAALRLTRAELSQIYERADAISDNRIEALQEV